MRIYSEPWEDPNLCSWIYNLNPEKLLTSQIEGILWTERTSKPQKVEFKAPNRKMFKVYLLNPEKLQTLKGITCIFMTELNPEKLQTSAGKRYILNPEKLWTSTADLTN